MQSNTSTENPTEFFKPWPTCLLTLDQMLKGGLRPGNLYVIGSRTSKGKTALALSIATLMAKSQSVGLLSMEMSHNAIVDRLVAMLGHVNLSQVINPDPNIRIEDHFAKAYEQMEHLKFVTATEPELTLDKTKSYVHYWQRAFNLNVLIIDYLGLMTGTNPKQFRPHQLDEIIRGLKQLSVDLNIAMIVLAQVNYSDGDEVDSRPNLAQLTNSSSIEQIADVVMLLHRRTTDPNLDHHASLYVVKNHHGYTGHIDLYFKKSQVRFEEWMGSQLDVNYSASSIDPHGFLH
jgi:replicative DNA helicase